MSKVVLSNGYEFTLADNGYTGDESSISFTIICNNKTLEEIESAFSGVDEFDVVLGKGDDTSYIAKYYGYTAIKEVAKLPQYSNGIDPETGEEIINTAFIIVCIKKSIDERLADLEEVVDDILAIIFGDEKLFPEDESEPEVDPNQEPTE